MTLVDNRMKGIKSEQGTRVTTKATLVYLFLSLLPVGIKFFLLPIYVNFLTPSDYGILSILHLFGSFYAAFSIFQLGTVAQAEYFKTNDKRAFEKKLVSTSILIGLIVFCSFYFAGPFFFDFFFTNIEVDFYPSGLVVLLTNLLSAIYGLFFIFFRNNYSLKELSFYSVLLVSCSSAFQYYLIAIQQLGYLGSLWGSLAASGLVGITILVKNHHMLTLKIDVRFVRDSLLLAIPMILSVLLVWLQRASDRIYLERFLSIEKVGLYSILMTVLGFALLINKAFGMAIRPTLFKYLLDQREYSNEIREIINQFILLNILSISGVLMIGCNLSLLTDQSRYQMIVPYFTLGAMLLLPKLLIKIPRLQLLFIGKTSLITLYSSVSVVLMVSLIPVLISFDIDGVLLSVFLAYTIEFTLYYISFRKSKIPHNISFAVKCLLFSTSVILIAFQFKVHFDLSYELFGLMQFLSVLIVLLMIGGKNIHSIVNLFKSRIR